MPPIRRPFTPPGQPGQPAAPAGLAAMMQGPQRAPMTGAPMGGPAAGMGGPTGAPGGAGMAGPPPPPSPPQPQPMAGGPTSPMNVGGSRMLSPAGPMGQPGRPGQQQGGPPGMSGPREPLPVWGDSQGRAGLPDDGMGKGMTEMAGANGGGGADGGAMGPMVMLRLMKALGRI